MTCSSCRDRLSERILGELAPRLAAGVDEHLARCAACARQHDEMSATLGLLERLGDEPLPAEFGAELHRKLVAAGPPRPQGLLDRLRARLAIAFSARPILTGALPIALGAAALVVALGHRPAHHAADALAQGEVQPVFHVPHARLAMVRIDFVAEEAVDDVEFAVVLPEGLHFVSEGRELPDREFRWRGRLAQGSNPIPIAVRGAKPGRYHVNARAVGRDVNAEHRVVLEVT